MNVSYTSREQIEVYTFRLPVALGIPLLALFLQAFLPIRIHFFSIFDLPLLVTIFFAVARRNPLSGLVTGCLIGLVQDGLSHHPLGLYGIAKTVIGYVASSLGVKIDVENPGSRFIMTFAFYVLHEAIYFTVVRGLARQALGWHWMSELGAALANAVMAVLVFAMLDRFKERT